MSPTSFAGIFDAVYAASVAFDSRISPLPPLATLPRSPFFSRAFWKRASSRFCSAVSRWRLRASSGRLPRPSVPRPGARRFWHSTSSGSDRHRRRCEGLKEAGVVDEEIINEEEDLISNLSLAFQREGGGWLGSGSCVEHGDGGGRNGVVLSGAADTGAGVGIDDCAADASGKVLGPLSGPCAADPDGGRGQRPRPPAARDPAKHSPQEQ